MAREGSGEGCNEVDALKIRKKPTVNVEVFEAEERATVARE
jgi:hypothetical protein